MTNDAPEKIWARTTKTKSGSWDDYHMVSQRFWSRVPSSNATEYIRADTDSLAARDAQVRAEALREAAEIAEFCLKNPEGETIEERSYAIQYRILALIPDQHKANG